MKKILRPGVLAGWGARNLVDQTKIWPRGPTPSCETSDTLTTLPLPRGPIREPIALTVGEDGLESQQERTHGRLGRVGSTAASSGRCRR